MKRIWGIPAVALVLLCEACAAGDASTDRQAGTLAEAIAEPRQTSAVGYARAALDTPLGRSPGFSVLEARNVPANGPEDVFVHLVFRIHHEGTDEGWTKADPVTACYTVEFTYQRMVHPPSRVACPSDAVPITLTPAPPKAEVPDTFDQPLRAILTALPAGTTEVGVRAALATGMPALLSDPATHLTGPVPDIGVSLRGTDVGVSYRTYEPGSGIECLLGSRSSAGVLVWRPQWREVQPGELPCDPESALDRQGIVPSR